MIRKSAAHRGFLFLVLAVLAVAIASTSPAGAWSQTNPPATQPKVYKLKGVVKSVDEKSHRITVAHDDIPGFMAAMTMPYKVGKAEDLKKLNPGDKIQADVVVGDGFVDLENIKVNGSGADAGDTKK
jgi:Cu(I)/Ag(I) efflux system periplasmic protein CusF